MFTFGHIQTRINSSKTNKYINNILSNHLDYIRILFRTYPKEMQNFTEASLINLLQVVGNKVKNIKHLEHHLKSSLWLPPEVKSSSVKNILKQYNYLYHNGTLFQNDNWAEEFIEYLPQTKAIKKEFYNIIEKGNLKKIPQAVLVYKITNNRDYLLQFLKDKRDFLTQDLDTSTVIKLYTLINMSQKIFESFNYSLKRKYDLAIDAIKNVDTIRDCSSMIRTLEEQNIDLPKIKKPKSIKEFHNKLVNYFIEQNILQNNVKLQADYSFLSTKSINLNMMKYLITYVESFISNDKLKEICHEEDYFNIEESHLKKLISEIKVFYPKTGADLLKIGKKMNICVGSYVDRVQNKQSVILALYIPKNTKLFNLEEDLFLYCCEYQQKYYINSLEYTQKCIKKERTTSEYIVKQLVGFRNETAPSLIEDYFTSLIKKKIDYRLASIKGLSTKSLL